MKAFFPKGLLQILLFLPSFLAAQTNIIPQPQSVVQSNEVFYVNNATTISSPQETKAIAGFLNEYLSANKMRQLETREGGKNNTINISINPKKITQKEGYHLEVSNEKIDLTGHDQPGVFYGLQSLLQLLERDTVKRTMFVKGVVIDDAPRFGYRGMHLDVSRHMFPLDFIKKYIDLLAFYKFNTFHWHLTDDQGWRIEIKRYPKLQSVAAFREGTLIGHKKELPHVFDNKRYGGYYTQNEAREIVAYAAKRNVTVIPEIEMPGHASAVLTAYPNLGCTGGPYEVAKFWGIFDEVFCAGNDETFHFLEAVLDEVLQIFPSEYIHIGGDECPKARWQACPKCQQRMKENNLKDENELQSYFVKRVEAHLLKQNRKVIGWDEILEGGLSNSATVMSWRGEAGGIQAAKQGNHVIMIPESHVYFDYYQSLHADEPLASAGYTPLSKVYSYNPVPKELSHSEKKYIKGFQGAVWSEYLNNTEHAEYMIFPRMLAVAEVAWTQEAKKNYADFLQRVDSHQNILKAFDIKSFQNYDEITAVFGISPNGRPLLTLNKSREHQNIHFTTDGSQPTVHDLKYENPVEISVSGTVKARLFENSHGNERIFSKDFVIAKSTGKPITITGQPAAGDASLLLNGVEGTARYNDGQWTNFSGKDMELIIDLQEKQTIKLLGINILKYHWQRMWAPTELIFFGSTNGKEFQELARENDFPLNGINRIRKEISPVSVRYIKVVAKNKGIVPAGEYGAGSRASLMLDEIIVN